MRKKKLLQRATAVFLAASMTLAMAACGGSEDTSTSAEGTDAAGEQEAAVTEESITFPLEEPITITAMVMDFNRDRTQYIDQLLEEKTNIKIDWTIVPSSDYETVLNLRLNSGELPDLIQVNKTAVNQFSDQGLFVDFQDYLPSMPNLQAWIEKIPAVYNDTALSDGSMYCVTTFNTRGQVPRQSIYRKDLFEKEGLDAPETIDELYDDLVLLKEKYPDSIPIVSRWGAGNLIGHVATLYQTRNGYYLDNEDLTYKYGPVTDNFKAAISMLQKFYAAGLIDPEFATVSDDQFVERITTGRALFMFAEYTCCLNTESQGDWIGNGKENDPDFELEAIDPLETEIGKGMLELQAPTARGSFAVAVNASSEYIDEIMAFLDYQYSDEIIDLVNWGVEGETYEVVDGEKEWLIDADERSELGVDGRSGMWVPLDQDCSDKGLDERDQEIVQAANEKAAEFAYYEPKKTLSFSMEEQDRISEVMTPINTYCEEQYMNFITGKLNMEEDWDEYVQTVTDMGYEEILQMYQEKYDALPEDEKGLDTELGF